jgi:hydrogenase expression/formation protein HypE
MKKRRRLDLKKDKFMDKNELIQLDHGGGGQKSWELIKSFREILKYKGQWKNTDDDGAVLDLACLPHRQAGKLVMTSDSFIVDPVFFNGGDVGKIAMCGTINDLSVMGAKPLGISLAIVIEEGFPMEDLKKIITSINEVSKKVKVPIVTGDTKVINKGKLDKIEITTAGIGLAENLIENKGLKPGDKIIASGSLGDHGVAILAHRFDYKTNLKSDCQPIFSEIQSVKKYLTSAKDPTRGGLAANIIEMAQKGKVRIILDEEKIPFKKETLAISNLLGIDQYILPSEGRFIAAVKKESADKAIKILKKFNKDACVIGEVSGGKGVFIKTNLGILKSLNMPEGKLIPRIC